MHKMEHSKHLKQDVLRKLHRCLFEVVSRKFQEWSKKVSRAFQERLKGVSREFQWFQDYLKEVIGNSREVSKKFQMCFKEVSGVFQESF